MNRDEKFKDLTKNHFHGKFESAHERYLRKREAIKSVFNIDPILINCLLSKLIDPDCESPRWGTSQPKGIEKETIQEIDPEKWEKIFDKTEISGGEPFGAVVFFIAESYYTEYDRSVLISIEEENYLFFDTQFSKKGTETTMRKRTKRRQKKRTKRRQKKRTQRRALRGYRRER